MATNATKGPITIYLVVGLRYYVRESDQLCIAVQSRISGKLWESSPALGRKLLGGIGTTSTGGLTVHSPAQPGDRLCFGGGPDESVVLGALEYTKSAQILRDDTSDATPPTRN